MVKRVVFTLLIITWCIIIFFLSSMPAGNSGNLSLDIAKKTVTFACKFAYKIGLLDHFPSNDAINNFAIRWHGLLRKIAHGVEFFVLAIILMFALRKTTNLCLKWVFFITVLCSFLYSLTDEFHQLYVQGRGASFKDCIIDTFGAFLAAIVYIIAKKIYYKIFPQKLNRA